ncbi:hypothetical protein PV327_001054 [Microctonus hyperodae]|uniref:Uncharacterized protein n=1 Tax=Microctonus hyperodae TaxID=165561 RepID=A0AA39G8E1_MICHY|nr:hypothetical protein PV327_001054 [Microctonus hyperodae]
MRQVPILQAFHQDAIGGREGEEKEEEASRTARDIKGYRGVLTLQRNPGPVAGPPSQGDSLPSRTSRRAQPLKSMSFLIATKPQSN